MPINKVVLRLEPFLEELKQSGVNRRQLAFDLGMNTKTISALAKGTEKGEWATAFKLREYLSEELGREVALEDLFEVSDES